MTVFRPDRYVAGLFQPNRAAGPVGERLYPTLDLDAAEPGLYEFDAVPYAIGYVAVTVYNAEAV